MKLKAWISGSEEVEADLEEDSEETLEEVSEEEEILEEVSEEEEEILEVVSEEEEEEILEADTEVEGETSVEVLKVSILIVHLDTNQESTEQIMIKKESTSLSRKMTEFPFN